MITNINEFKQISEHFQYHIDNKLSIFDNNIFRPFSEAFFTVIKEARKNIDLCIEEDRKLFETTDIGLFEFYENKLVPLDIPMFNEEFISINEELYKGKDVELNKPKRGGKRKKYYVYVKNPENGKIKKIEFGDVHGGLTAKVSDPEARKAFAARHKCHLKNDKMKAGYWSCRLTRFSHIFGQSYPGFW